MKITPVNNSNSTSFGRLIPVTPDITSQQLKEISSLPLVKKFSQNYNANIDITPYSSKRNPKKVHLVLSFDEIKPVSIMAKIKNLFSKKTNHSIIVKTKADNYDDFISELSHKRSEKLLNLIHAE